MRWCKRFVPILTQYLFHEHPNKILLKDHQLSSSSNDEDCLDCKLSALQQTVILKN